ncbi:TlpA disulfide reductase family protein [Capnocytophaga sp.]|uniref:TlpA disulfide reductase family protein n=1 Tax=Capnocytophaga sp. TaxID=44737 RepID=UPI0026DC2413|nr:TlpA disulfide reductase family protein [Capnocytophaga sp.]MDO5104775.1 TlpA disulfide reductase family protein [Capnocytophaga sp.]
MKKRHLICVISLLFFAVSCQENSSPGKATTFTIEGSVPANMQGKVHLFEFKNQTYTPVDSVEINNGIFKFTGSVTEPLLYSLRLNNIGKRANFFLENTAVKMQLSTNWEITKIEGTANTLLFKKYDDTNKRKSVNLDSLLKTDNSSPVITYFLGRNAYLYDFDALVSLRNQIADELTQNTYIKELDSAITKLASVQPGKPAPEITMEDTNGNTFKLSDLKGKNVLIDFWASWCPDCRKQNPNLVTLYSTYKDKNFTILGVSLDRNKDHWKQAIVKDKLTWQQGFVEGGWKSDVAKTYALRWLPTSILIDKQGIIIARNIENEKLINDIEKLISEK